MPLLFLKLFVRNFTSKLKNEVLQKYFWTHEVKVLKYMPSICPFGCLVVCVSEIFSGMAYENFCVFLHGACHLIKKVK